MTTQALIGVKTGVNNVIKSIKNVPHNVSVLKMGKEGYINSRIDANLENILQCTTNSKKQKAISKIVEKASKDFGTAKKQVKTAGIAGAVAAGVAVVAGIIVSKAIKAKNAEAAQNQEQASTTEDKGVDTVA